MMGLFSTHELMVLHSLGKIPVATTVLNGHHIVYSKGKDQPGKVANPARGQLNRENYYFPAPIRA